MKYGDNLSFEESIDAFSKEQLEVLEVPLSRRTFVLLFAAALLAAAAASGRIFFLTGWKGDFYRARAEANAGKEVRVPAGRGIIYDRFGTPLVENVPTFSISVKYGEALEAARILGIPEDGVKKQLAKTNPEKDGSIVIARNIDTSMLVTLKSLNLDSVEIVDDYKRSYVDGPVFSHVIGYTGLGEGNEVVGKVGLEEAYDALIRGEDGTSVMYRNAKGASIDKKLVQHPRNGTDIHTTIDADLQRYFYKRLSDQLRSLGRNAGVGIAIDPENGEVLSLVSLPSFDSNVFSTTGKSGERQKTINAPFNPLFNRAISGAYTPGSVVKPMVAAAALKEGLVTPETQVFSAGFIEIPNPYFPDKPSRFLDWKPHGWVDLHSAIARSSNIYFYAAGGGWQDIKGLGIQKLKEYWKKFGFGAKTGIDLASESEGFLPDPEYKQRKKNDPWRLGDTYNVTIGQGDLMVTPIQIISQISSIANGGLFYRPHLFLRATAPGGETVQEGSSEVMIDNSAMEPYLRESRIGMEDTVTKPYGTARILNDLPFVAAGKTGSSQIANNTKTNAFFAAYAPSNPNNSHPKIAVLVLIEDAKEGSLNAVPVGKDVLEWYYEHRIKTGN